MQNKFIWVVVIFTFILIVLPGNLTIVASNYTGDELFFAGFETRGFFPFSEPTLQRGTAEIITTDALDGVYAFRSIIETDSGTRRASIARGFEKSSDNQPVVWAKFYFKLDNSFVNTRDNSHALIGGFARSGHGMIVRSSIYHSNDIMTLGLYGVDSSGGGLTPLERNIWYCCELEYDTEQGRVAVYLNGNLERESTGLTEMEDVNVLQLGWQTWIEDQGGGVIFDNVQVTTERQPYREQEMKIIAPPSFFGRIGMKFMVFLTRVYDSDQFRVTLTGDQGYEQQVYYKNSGVEKTFDFDLDLRTLDAGDYTLLIEFLNASGDLLASDVRKFNKPYNGLPVTGINENSAVCLNGEPMFFINALGLSRGRISFWTNRQFCNAQRGYFDQTQTPESFSDYLDKAQTAGTYVMGPLRDTTWINKSPLYPTLDEITLQVEAMKDHPALFFWDWLDEPISEHSRITGSVEGTIALVRDWTEKTHELDPQHLVFTSEWATLSNLAHVQAKIFYPDWVADVYSFDIYPSEWEEETGDKVSEAAELNECYYRYNYGLMPFSAWVEPCDVRPKGRAHDVTLYPPTQEQLRMLAWIPIVHGAKGISWFHYFGAVPPENYVQMSEVVRFMEAYKDIILGPEPKNIKITDDANMLGRRVDTMVRETDTDIYVFAIRVSEVAGEVYVNPEEQGDITVNFTEHGSPMADAVIEDVFSVFTSADHQEWDVSETGQTYNLQLREDVEPGSVIIGGGYLSSDSDVGYPTKWVYLYDDGQGNLMPEFRWEPGTGTIDYETGVITCDFEKDIDVGEDKIHAGYFPENTTVRNLNMINRQFSDVFERCELHVYRIPKSNENMAPTITRHPTTKSIIPGGDVAFSVTAAGTPTLIYQWQKDGEDIPGADQETLIITDAQPEDSGEYRVIVSNSEGTVMSNTATLTVINPPPKIPSFNSKSEYYTSYLYWENPDQIDEWDKVIVLRKFDSRPVDHTDGDIVYEGRGNSFIDRDLMVGTYHYAVYTYKGNSMVGFYSEPAYTEVDIPETYNKNYLKIKTDLKSIQIGQNTRNDLFSIWNTEINSIAKGPGGNETDLWVYSDLIGNGQYQIPVGSKIVSAKLVFNIEKYIFNNTEDSYNSDNENNTNEDTVNNIGPHGIKVYQITDPDNLGIPYFADESGLRVGLDFYYRDHRPGVHKPWVNSEDNTDDNSIDNKVVSSILDLFTDNEEGTKDAETPVDDIDLNTGTDRYAIDSIEFYPDVFENELLDTIRFDITEAVQAWSNGEVDGEENQGLFITTGHGWKYGEYLTLSGITAEDEDKRPYIEVIYSDTDSADLIAPEPVGEVTIEPGPDSITLNWTNPGLSDSANLNIAGVKIMRREGIVPFDEHDGDLVMIIDNINSSAGTFTDTGLITGKIYYYAIYTYDNEHNYSDKVWIKATPGSPESAPSNFAISIGQGSAELSWEEVTGANSYRLYREDSSGDVKVVEITVEGDNLTYTDYLLLGEYTYRVTAVNGNGEGPSSNVVEVNITEDNMQTDLPPTPTGFEAIRQSGTEIELSWDSIADTCVYVIEKEIEEDQWEEVAVKEFDEIRFVDRNLLPDTQYKYRIKSVNSRGESESYAGISVTTNGLSKPISVKNISWEVISASQIKVKWEDTPNKDCYKVELFELSEDGQIGDEEALDTQTISGITYCYFVTLESGKEYRVRITTIKGEDIAEAESDIIRTSADSKGGLF